MILARHVDACTITWINGPFELTETIKDERKLHIGGQGHVFMSS